MLIKITKPVTHINRIYQAGQVVDLPAADAKHLIEGGFAEKHTPEKEPTKPEGAKPPAE